MTASTHSPPTCPSCGRAAAPIVYGLPGPELVQAAERGEVIIGGCCITADEAMANLGCTFCGNEWHDPDYVNAYDEPDA